MSNTSLLIVNYVYWEEGIRNIQKWKSCDIPLNLKDHKTNLSGTLDYIS